MTPFSLNIKGRLVEFDRPAIMAVINATPDSFYATSRVAADADAAIRAVELIAHGADILDIGAFSTKPGAVNVSLEEEIARLKPVVQAVRRVAPDTLLSVDTFCAEVARIAVEEWGADIVNDISGGNLDEAMFQTVCDLSVPYVLGHSRGDVEKMSEYTTYEMVTRDVLAELGDRLQQLALMGVSDVIIDPGFGFSKTLEQNYTLLHDLELFGLFHRPILVGFSRKSMITKVIGRGPEEALNGTTVLNTLALDRGASILRVHDPREAAEAVKIYQKLNSCQVSE